MYRILLHGWMEQFSQRMMKEGRLRWLGHADQHSDNSMVKQPLFATRMPGHVQPVLVVYAALRDVSDAGQQIGYHSLE